MVRVASHLEGYLGRDGYIAWDEVEDWDVRVPARPARRTPVAEWQQYADDESWLLGEQVSRWMRHREQLAAAREAAVRAVLDRQQRLLDRLQNRTVPVPAPVPPSTPPAVAPAVAPPAPVTPAPAPAPARRRVKPAKGRSRAVAVAFCRWCGHKSADHGSDGCSYAAAKLRYGQWVVSSCQCEATADQVLEHPARV